MCLFVVSKTLKLDLVRCKPKTNNCMQPMLPFARAVLYPLSSLHHHTNSKGSSLLFAATVLSLIPVHLQIKPYLRYLA